jgi:glycosyltransferase involved in cell wall biosynthesis
MRAKKKILFVTWDGPQVDYLEGLFFPILQSLAETYKVHILQFTWGDPAKSERIGSLCAALGMSYERATVRRSPSVLAGTTRTLWAGTRLLRKIFRKDAPDLVIYRSTFPSLMALWALRGRPGIKKILDADGFPLEERVDFGGLKEESLQYRFLKARELEAVRSSDGVWVRTRVAMKVLSDEGMEVVRCRVVQNGRDSNVFKLASLDERRRIREELGIPEGAKLVVYCGSLGPQYCVEEMLSILRYLLELGRDARLLILTGNPAAIDTRLSEDLRDYVVVRSVPFAEVSTYLGAADAGLAVRMSSYSMTAVSPIKLGEYLLCGLPVVASRGIGDTESMLSGETAAFLLDDHSEKSLREAATWLGDLGDDLRESARRLGMAHYDLATCLHTYQESVKSMLDPC